MLFGNPDSSRNIRKATIASLGNSYKISMPEIWNFWLADMLSFRTFTCRTAPIRLGFAASNSVMLGLVGWLPTPFACLGRVGSYTSYELTSPKQFINVPWRH
jgi:hypothetical protein